MVNLTGWSVSLKNTEGHYGFRHLMDTLLTFNEAEARGRGKIDAWN
jgi:hypothetical protein